MDEYKARMRALDEKVAKLAHRIERLEEQPRCRPRPPHGATSAPLALIEHLRGRKKGRYRAKGMQGAIAYGGAAVLGERECLWVREHPLPDVVDLDPDRLAQVLTALAHSARLVLLRSLLEKARTSQELQAVLGVSSPGQLYHHLKELLAAGIVTQARRSHYEIAPRQVVPLLTVLATAFDLVDTQAAPSEIEASSDKEN
ncbi:MAG: helix-turn-helix domain-containing protein [Vicinamibacteria bacterium]|nr:helix-turn-helix domain-containing protein [Vicinamibacteria bacterium]